MCKIYDDNGMGFDIIPFNKLRQEQFNTLKPTFITSAYGIDWYEHPIFGDEAPLIVLKDGLWFNSEEWEV